VGVGSRACRLVTASANEARLEAAGRRRPADAVVICVTRRSKRKRASDVVCGWGRRCCRDRREQDV
jgi:hypothetical protein